MHVPDLHLRRAAKVDAAVRLGHRFVFDEQLDVAELLVRRRVRAGAVIDQLAVLDAPVLRKFLALLFQARLAFFALELRDRVRIQAVPTREIIAVEDRAKAFRRRRFRGAKLREQEGGENEENCGSHGWVGEFGFR